MYAHCDRLRVPVLIGVGAAFDINSGMKQQAPILDARTRDGMLLFRPYPGASTALAALHTLRPLSLFFYGSSRTAWSKKIRLTIVGI